ncbi:MAG: ABC transporter permease [Lautropia sp.]
MNPLRLSSMLLARDWRAGELNLLLAALVVAVAAISTVGFFVDRLGAALSTQARQLLGADLVVSTDNPVPAEWSLEAQRRGLRVATTVVFPSMALTEPSDAAAAPRSQLASIKAVSSAYPLRGALTFAGAGAAAAAATASPAAAAAEGARGGPAPGRVWADRALLDALGIGTGGKVLLGDKAFVVERTILIEPDRGASFASFAPRAMIALDDLAATGLIQPASRVTWRLLVAGDAAAVSGFEGWVSPRLGAGQRLETLEGGRPELRTTLERARQFLSLVSMLAALIAAVAIALAARRFADRHLDGFAVLKSLGAGQPLIQRALLFEMLWIALAGSVVGALAGWAAHWVLVAIAGPAVGIALPPPGWAPAIQAAAAGVVLVLGFAAIPVLRLAGVPPLRVLRRELGPPGASVWFAVAIAMLAFGALLLWYAQDRRLALMALGGFAVGAVCFTGVAWIGVRALAPLRGWVGAGGALAALRVALANWSRRRGASVAQTAALAVGLMALMLLTVTRNDLLESWRSASPADAPNRFVLNIQPDQREAFTQALDTIGVRDVELFPMIRGRLVTVNGAPVGPQRYEDDRAKRLVDREFNLSYGAQMPSHNRLASGRWIDPARAEVSAEQGILDTLGLSIGDTLGFDVAGQTTAMKLVGTRKLAWDSLKVNFFMIGSPAALADRPQSFITSFRMPPSAASGGERALVARFPNLTIIDTDVIVRQVQAIIDRVVQAVQFLFVFALAAGLVVMYAALASSRDERMHEAALMRALGASRRQLVVAQALELSLSGMLAGLLAALGALLVGWLLATEVFLFPYSPGWWLVPAGALLGALFSAGAGWWGLRTVVDAPPMGVLRAAG